MIGVYAILNTESGMMYVGSSRDVFDRARNHFLLLRGNRHTNRILQDDFNRRGELPFVISILEECSEDSLRVREQWWMDNTMGKYNLAKNARGGASSGRRLSPETKEKIRAAQKGKPRKKHTAETRKRISELMRGRIFSEEWKKKISENRRGKNNGVVSETTRQKLREATARNWERKRAGL